MRLFEVMSYTAQLLKYALLVTSHEVSVIVGGWVIKNHYTPTIYHSLNGWLTAVSYLSAETNE